MASPLGLTVKTDITTMQIGDCIPCRYTATTSGQGGYFSELGTCTATEIPLTSSATPNGLFYINKISKGLLIADRVVQHSISWDALNLAKFIEGYIYTEDKINSQPNSQSVYSSNSFGSNIAPNAFVNNASFWQSNGSATNGATNQWLAYKYDEQVSVKNIKITYYDSTYVFNGLKVLGSNNSTNGVDGTWDELTTTLTNGITNIDLNIINKYKWYKFLNTGGGNYIRVTYLQMFISRDILIRSLSGGCAYADINGNSVTTDQSLGAFPSMNEYDKYIRLSDLNGKITKGDDNVWHWSNLYSWVKETPILSIGANTLRCYRGKDSLHKFGSVVSSTSTTATGFRPVFEILETDNVKSTNLFY